MGYYILLDVGGTTIKAARIYEKDNKKKAGEKIVVDILSYPSKAEGSKQEIIENFSTIIGGFLDRNEKLLYVGLAFPGPFDYEKGVSLVKGLGKYYNIYKVGLKEELLKKIDAEAFFENPNMIFMHDIEAFIRGEVVFGSTAKSKKAMYICIGTGCGSGFSENGKFLKNHPQLPDNCWIYDTPFRESIIDDYISARGIEKLAQEYFDKRLTGKELFELAKQGNAKALLLFQEFGENLVEAIEEYVGIFKPDTLVIGGQISKSFEFFGEQLTNLCAEKGIRTCVNENISESTILGLLK